MLRIEHVSKTYPTGTQALKDVSFEVRMVNFWW
jgi:ABC-type ATPase involved in cell division